MSLINLKNIVSCSSEDQSHSANNLLKLNKWLSSKGTEDRITCTIELEKPSVISSIDISNDGCAFIELLVTNSLVSSDDDDDDWHILLPRTSLMSPTESKSNINRNKMKTIKSIDFNIECLNKKWDRLKIICEQKLNRTDQFGLNFIKLYSMSDTNNNHDNDDDEDETEKEQKKIGSYFAKKQVEKKRKTIHNDDNQAKIMKNVVFVLSGFQNPLRSELRNKATSMGAIYSEDWDEKSTHLICAFSNTPKFNQVEQTGKGFIVNQQWILDCYQQNRLLPEKSYELKQTNKQKLNNDAGSDTSNDAKRKTPVKRKSKTTTNDETDEIKFDVIPDFFHEKHFYVSYGDYDDNTLLDIIRVILAYDGILERQINSDVKYVITKRMWNQDFEKISKSNPGINFVNLDWLQDCHDEERFVPVESYLIVR